jgi:hypothetical protein
VKTGFVTLCVGKTHIDYSALTDRLAISLKEQIGADLHVYTYDNEFETIAESNVVRIPTFSSAPKNMNACFNFNLKGIVTHHFFNNSDYDQVVFLDCDIVMNNATNAFQAEMFEKDIWGNYSEFGEAHVSLQSGDKFRMIADLLDISHDIFVGALYFSETIFMFNRTDKSKEVLGKWAEICEAVSQTKINPAYECVEFGIALRQSGGVECGKLNTTTLRTDNVFSTEHRDKMLPVVQN